MRAVNAIYISLPTTDTQKFYMRKREEKEEYTKKESEKPAKKCRATWEHFTVEALFTIHRQRRNGSLLEVKI